MESSGAGPRDLVSGLGLGTDSRAPLLPGGLPVGPSPRPDGSGRGRRFPISPRRGRVPERPPEQRTDASTETREKLRESLPSDQ